MHRYAENFVLLALGISIAAIGIPFPIASGHIFRNGAPALLAVFLIVKGGRNTRCNIIDLMLGIAMLTCVLLSKIVPARIVSPDLLQIVALVLGVILFLIGPTPKATSS